SFQTITARRSPHRSQTTIRLNSSGVLRTCDSRICDRKCDGSSQVRKIPYGSVQSVCGAAALWSESRSTGPMGPQAPRSCKRNDSSLSRASVSACARAGEGGEGSWLQPSDKYSVAGSQNDVRTVAELTSVIGTPHNCKW